MAFLPIGTFRIDKQFLNGNVVVPAFELLQYRCDGRGPGFKW